MIFRLIVIVISFHLATSQDVTEGETNYKLSIFNSFKIISWSIHFWDLWGAIIRRGIGHVLVFYSFSCLDFTWWNGFGASFCTVLAWVRYVWPWLLRHNANKATGTGDITGYLSSLLSITLPDALHAARSWRPI